MPARSGNITLADRIAFSVVFAIGCIIAVLWMLNEARRSLQSLLCGRRAAAVVRAAHGEPPLPASYHDARWGSHGRIMANGVLFHYVAKGPEDAPLMLCLHGFPECWYSWRYVLEAFSCSHRVVAIDLRGYGETAHAAASWWSAHDVSLRVLVQDVHDLISAFGKRSAVLVSHDWGGQVGWAFAAAHPGMVDKLVIMNSPHPLLFRRNMTLAQAAKSSYMALFQVPLIPELLLSAGNFNFLHAALLGRGMGVRRSGPLVATEDDVAVNRWVFTRAGTLTAALNYYRAVLTDSAAYLRSVNMKGITAPTLVVWGEEDGALGLQLCDGLEKVCNDVRLVKLANASHWVQQDAVEDVVAAMATFLRCETAPLAPVKEGSGDGAASSSKGARSGRGAAHKRA